MPPFANGTGTANTGNKGYTILLVSLKYKCVSVHFRPSSVNVFNLSCVSEASEPMEANFNGQRPWVMGIQADLNGVGHATKMATVPIHGKIV